MSKTKISDKLRRTILERDGYKCLVCGSTVGLHIDHVVSELLGGETEESNLQTLCSVHNNIKDNARFSIDDLRKLDVLYDTHPAFRWSREHPNRRVTRAWYIRGVIRRISDGRLKVPGEEEWLETMREKMAETREAFVARRESDDGQYLRGMQYEY